MKVFLPTTVSETCSILADHPGVVPVAGGTDLFVHWPQKSGRRGDVYVDLSGLSELRPFRWTPESLVLGAMTTYWDLMGDDAVRGEFPLLEEVARQVGAVQIQTRGTWAGNIMNASPAADGVAVLLAYGARITLKSATERETIPLSQFYLGYKEMRRRPDQLLTEIHIPRREIGFQLFQKVGSRAAQAITKVGIAVTHDGDGWRVVANSVAPTVCRCPTLEDLLGRGEPVGRASHLLEAVGDDVSPIDDLRSTALYRKTVLTRLLYFGLKDHCPSFS